METESSKVNVLKVKISKVNIESLEFGRFKSQSWEVTVPRTVSGSLRNKGSEREGSERESLESESSESESLERSCWYERKGG